MAHGRRSMGFLVAGSTAAPDVCRGGLAGGGGGGGAADSGGYHFPSLAIHQPSPWDVSLTFRPLNHSKHALHV